MRFELFLSYRKAVKKILFYIKALLAINVFKFLLKVDVSQKYLFAIKFNNEYDIYQIYYIVYIWLCLNKLFYKHTIL